MDVKELFEREQEMIERELIELETIAEAEIINYANLAIVLKKLVSISNDHEKKRQFVFSYLKSKGIKVPITGMFFADSGVNNKLVSLVDAMHSGSEFKVKQCLGQDGADLIAELRQHIEQEGWILYSVPEVSVEELTNLLRTLSSMPRITFKYDPEENN